MQKKIKYNNSVNKFEYKLFYKPFTTIFEIEHLRYFIKLFSKYCRLEMLANWS